MLLVLFVLGIGSPVGGPHSLGEIRGAAAVGKASAAARNFLRVPSAPREPMATGCGANAGTAHRRPRSHGRWCGASFFKENLKAPMQPRAAVRAKPFYLAGLGRTAVRAHGLKCIGNSRFAGSLW